MKGGAASLKRNTNLPGIISLSLVFTMLIFLLSAAFPKGNRNGLLEAKSQSADNKYAIIVGINNYDDQEVTGLHCAVSDARAIADILIRKMGFQEEGIFLFTSDQKGKGAPRRGNIAVALGNIQNIIRPGGTFIFFFSGHGINMDGENFLLTQEAIPANRVSLEETALKVSRIREYIEKMEADKVLLIIDACRTDPGGGKKGGERNLMSQDFAKSLVIKAGSSGNNSSGHIKAAATLFSCSRGESSYEWMEKGNGFFTHFLIKGLNGEAADVNGSVTLNSIESYLAEKVKNAAKVQRGAEQTPWMERTGMNPGEWMLTGKGREVSAKPADSSVTANWSGTWKTNFGLMTLVQNGNSVTGTYAWNGGRIIGELQGQSLIGTWSQEKAAQGKLTYGKFEFTLDSPGRSFTGKWCYGDQSWGDNVWNGER